jgi:hypothetical protein
MSDNNKAFPKGLKDEEVERGRLRRPPIPYIPPEDPIQGHRREDIGYEKLQSHVARWDDSLPQGIRWRE